MAFVIFVINGNVAFLAFSGSCYLKSIPAVVVNGRTPRASIRFGVQMSLDLSAFCSCARWEFEKLALPNWAKERKFFIRAKIPGYSLTTGSMAMLCALRLSIGSSRPGMKSAGPLL
ncbi:hypothetical protein H0E87_029730 [Populus deltoides]|uniref:Uncharacterized protein n=1 Tax=Populus deltoides TaxID=3696 RepID=A0A8T2WM27_POPDE|nr:hypothetical protein H0E87_029730 [Populus deltoides]